MPSIIFCSDHSLVADDSYHHIGLHTCNLDLIMFHTIIILFLWAGEGGHSVQQNLQQEEMHVKLVNSACRN